MTPDGVDGSFTASSLRLALATAKRPGRPSFSSRQFTANANPMSSLSPGTRLGPYEITAKIGEGGMGEVYRGTDTRLKREVAIKVLPAAFTEDKERLARFEREAQLLAQLHHPNIASIFGLEESHGTRALVMELVEGPTLADRLESGAFSITESLSTALQIAQALEEAHDKGIVHRDLKPQNIKASSEGKTKVLDFGLAKAMDATIGSASAADLARSPTIMNSPTLTAAHGTQLGVILGTAAYMAPEQAAGGAVDRRADIWSFGVVLYEMLSGRRLFDGETVSHVLAGVLEGHARLLGSACRNTAADRRARAALPAQEAARAAAVDRRRPPRARRGARRSAPRRGRCVRSARRACPQGAVRPSPGSSPRRASSPQRSSRCSGLARRSAVPAERIFHASLVAPVGTGFTDYFALSPDGRRVVFEAFDKETGARASLAARARPRRGHELRVDVWRRHAVLVSRRSPDRLLRRRQAEAARPAGRAGADDLRRTDAAWRRVGTGRPDRLLARLPRRPLDRARDRRRAAAADDARRCPRREEPPLPGLPSRRQADPLPGPDGGGRRAQRRERDRGARARERRAHPPHRR